MYTYKVKHVGGSELVETVTAGSVHYGTGSEWVKFYAEPHPNREYIPVYAIRADVVGSIDRVNTFHSTRVLVYAGKPDGRCVYTDPEDTDFRITMSGVSRHSLGNPDDISVLLEPKNSSSIPHPAKDKPVSDKVQIAAQLEEIRRLQAELAAKEGRLVYMGGYDSNNLYYKNNSVTYQGGTYYALRTVPRNTAPTDTKYWATMVPLSPSYNQS